MSGKARPISPNNHSVKKIVTDADEKAFIYCFPISQAKDGVFKKRPLHE
jgi:hypothetical protein